MGRKVIIQLHIIFTYNIMKQIGEKTPICFFVARHSTRPAMPHRILPCTPIKRAGKPRPYNMSRIIQFRRGGVPPPAPARPRRIRRPRRPALLQRRRDCNIARRKAALLWSDVHPNTTYRGKCKISRGNITNKLQNLSKYCKF